VFYQQHQMPSLNPTGFRLHQSACHTCKNHLCL